MSCAGLDRDGMGWDGTGDTVRSDSIQFHWTRGREGGKGQGGMRQGGIGKGGTSSRPQVETLHDQMWTRRELWRAVPVASCLRLALFCGGSRGCDAGTGKEASAIPPRAASDARASALASLATFLSSFLAAFSFILSAASSSTLRTAFSALRITFLAALLAAFSSALLEASTASLALPPTFSEASIPHPPNGIGSLVASLRRFSEVAAASDSCALFCVRDLLQKQASLPQLEQASAVPAPSSSKPNVILLNPFIGRCAFFAFPISQDGRGQRDGPTQRCRSDQARKCGKSPQHLGEAGCHVS